MTKITSDSIERVLESFITAIAPTPSRMTTIAPIKYFVITLYASEEDFQPFSTLFEKHLTSNILYNCFTMRIETIEVGVFACCCYVVEREGEALVIDSGWEAEKVAERICSLDSCLVYILCTHGHIDHAGAVSELKGLFPKASVGMHSADLPLYKATIPEIDAFYPGRSKSLKIEIPLNTENELSFGGTRIKVLHTPGHTPGGVSFYFEEDGVIFSGDTLFAGSIGRTDFPGGDFDQLINSIRTQILSLPDETVVYPGHGPTTTVGAERTTNPFLFR